MCICLPNEIQQVPANKKPLCIRNRSQFSNKTMNKTIDYRSKTARCTQKSGFLFAETRCNNQSFDKNIPDSNSFDENVPDADSKKIIQHNFKVKKNLRGDYMSYVWRMWGKRDIQCHDKREAMYYHKAGSLSLSCKSYVKFVHGKKSCLCVRHLWLV